MGSDKTKIFVLDTNIIMDNHNAITEFDNNIVVIPSQVVKETNNYKSERSDRGYHSRNFLKARRDLSALGNLAYEGVVVNEKGGKLLESYKHMDLPSNYLRFNSGIDSNDLEILKCALMWQEMNKEYDVTLITNDNALIGSALINGISSEMRLADTVKVNDLYTGYVCVEDAEVLSKMQSRTELSQLDLEDLINMSGSVEKFSVKPIKDWQSNEKFEIKGEKIDREEFYSSLMNNEFVAFTTKDGLFKSMNTKEKYQWDGDSNIQITRKSYDPNNNQILKNLDWQKIKKLGQKLGIKPKNFEQAMALDLCLDEQVSVPILYGVAGTGKTLMAIASAYNIQNEGHRRGAKILLTKPHQNVGNEEYGFLPGDLDEKVIDNYASVDDAFRTLLQNSNEQDIAGQGLLDLIKAPGAITQIRPLGYMRGVNIKSDESLIAEEMQNATQTTMKTILTRLNTGGTLTITGDPWQLDNPYLRVESNGLTYLIDTITKTQKDPNSRQFGVVKMSICERGQVAEFAARHL